MVTIHLYCANLPQVARFFLDPFAELLDYTPTQLDRTLSPNFRSDNRGARRAYRAFNALYDSSHRMPKRQRVLAAANGLADAGAALLNVGMHEESEQFYGWSMWRAFESRYRNLTDLDVPGHDLHTYAR